MYRVQKIGSAITGSATTAVFSLFDQKCYPHWSVQANIAGTGAVSATVTVKGSLDGVNFVTISNGTLSLSGTTTDSKFVTTTEAWAYMEAVVTSVSGTGASIDIFLGT